MDRVSCASLSMEVRIANASCYRLLTLNSSSSSGGFKQMSLFICSPNNLACDSTETFFSHINLRNCLSPSQGQHTHRQTTHRICNSLNDSSYILGLVHTSQNSYEQINRTKVKLKQQKQFFN